MKKYKHIHKYERVTIGRKGKKNKGYQVLRCRVPGCPHYAPIVLAEGNICECWRCGKPMALDRRSVKMAKPHCYDCVEKKDQGMHDKLKRLLEQEV